MGFIKNIFGKKQSKETSDFTDFVSLQKEDFKTFEDLVEQNAGLSFEKQFILSEIIGTSPWELDMGTGKIYFGELEFPIQIIGSLAFSDNSWLWGWQNTQSGIPENLLVQSNQLREIGNSKNIGELTNSLMDTEKGFEHKIGMIACGLFNTKCYYCANYGEGTLVVTIDDEKIPEVDKNDVVPILTKIPQLICGLELNHQNTFLNYLIDKDLKLNISENKIEGLKGNTTLVAEFDNLHRLKSLDSKLTNNQ